jgi:hypothetical protein
MTAVTLTAANEQHIENDLDAIALEVHISQCEYGNRRGATFPFTRRTILTQVRDGETYEQAAMRRAVERYAAKTEVTAVLEVTVTTKRGMGALGDSPADLHLPVAV